MSLVLLIFSLISQTSLFTLENQPNIWKFDSQIYFFSLGLIIKKMRGCILKFWIKTHFLNNITTPERKSIYQVKKKSLLNASIVIMGLSAVLPGLDTGKIWPTPLHWNRVNVSENGRATKVIPVEHLICNHFSRKE